jgi:GMP synthase (glutamine-hydrolysing)
LSSFYKDEVRAIGRELGLPVDLLERHPFPGPGLAIRLLCAETAEPIERLEDGWLVPVHSVGVQGDSRSYRPVLAVENGAQEQATAIINRNTRVNRVVALAGSHAPLARMAVRPAALDPTRLSRLRAADAIVRSLSHHSGFDSSVWQFPVVVIPAGTADRPDSVVLRPIHSIDGMTAQSVPIPAELLTRMTGELLALDGVCAVFQDLTHKPPATIEWE